ncbi:MAG: hypothetical protein ACT4NT_04445 [Nitrososphaerota archaeon]
MNSRRGVGGLISMIGLLAVFSVIGVAFLSLSSQQTSLFATQQRLNEIQHDRNLETFEAKVLRCEALTGTHADFITIRINNTSSQTLTVDSFILHNVLYQNVTDVGFSNKTKIHVLPQESKIVDIKNIRYLIESPDVAPSDNADRMILVTDLGNKMIINYDFAANCV